jgi:hypothetical protein
LGVYDFKETTGLSRPPCGYGFADFQFRNLEALTSIKPPVTQPQRSLNTRKAVERRSLHLNVRSQNLDRSHGAPDPDIYGSLVRISGPYVPSGAEVHGKSADDALQIAGP